MANRHLSRSVALQSLFEWDFHGASSDTESFREIVTRDVEEFAPETKDTDFIFGLALGVVEKRDKIDQIIEKAAPDWPIAKISPIDRNVLRIGLYELLFGDPGEVPPKVAINEAIELAKGFGGETSGKFVNGVLGAVYKELGEPGKNQTSKKEKIDLSTLPTDMLVGALVYARHEGVLYIGLVHDIFGKWTLVKGHMQDNESQIDAVKRKVRAELGAETVAVGVELGVNAYGATDPEKGKIRKEVHYYLVEGAYGDLSPEKSGGLDDARWFPVADVPSLTLYDDMLPIVTKGIATLLEVK